MKIKKSLALFCLVLTVFLAVSPAGGETVRIKDITEVEGVRGNQLVGYGLVVGLAGSFVQSGEEIDVTVSSLGDAKTLQGGVLLLTPLKAVDGKVYAVAQGPLSIGGFNVGGGGGNVVQQNHPTVGMIPGGRSFHSSITGARFCDRFSYCSSY